MENHGKPWKNQGKPSLFTPEAHEVADPDGHPEPRHGVEDLRALHREDVEDRVQAARQLGDLRKSEEKPLKQRKTCKETMKNEEKRCVSMRFSKVFIASHAFSHHFWPPSGHLSGSAPLAATGWRASAASSPCLAMRRSPPRSSPAAAPRPEAKHR